MRIFSYTRCGIAFTLPYNLCARTSMHTHHGVQTITFFECFNIPNRTTECIIHLYEVKERKKKKTFRELHNINSKRGKSYFCSIACHFVNII